MSSCKPYLLAAFLLLRAGFTFGQDFMTNVYERDVTSLNGRWEALVDLYARGKQMGIYKNLLPQGKTDFYEYYFSNQLRLDVPGAFNSQYPAFEYYESSMWYRRYFDYDLPKGERLFVYFGAANYTCTAYLNGVELGTHEGGFSPFQFEITNLVRPKDNFLIVEVNNARSADAIPSLIYDWWNYGGLTRDVLLVKTPDNYIDDYFFRLSDDGRYILADVSMARANAGEQIQVVIPELKIDARCITDKQGRASLKLSSRGISRWSPENPKRYMVELKSSEDRISEEIGFRTIAVVGSRIVLNGEPLFLRGINCHDEIPMRRGRTHSDMEAAMLIDEVKSLGCNFLRLTHCPPSENMVRLAERQGLLLFEEIPQWQEINFHNEKTNQLARTMMKEMIRRDKNRCAIIAWSVANETRLYPERDKALTELVGLTRSLDDSRLVTAVTDKVPYDKEKGAFTTSDDLLNALDLVCVNRYLGWYMPWPAPPEEIRWEICPDKPLLLSEFGGEALYGHTGPHDAASSWSEEYQEQLYRKHIEMFPTIPNLCGVAPWVLFDFRSPYRMHGRYQEGWNRKGLLSENGHRKKAWYVMKEYYDSITSRSK